MLSVLRSLLLSIPRTNGRIVILAITTALLSPGLTSCGGGDRSSSTTLTPPMTPPVTPPAPTSGVTVALSPRTSALTIAQPQTLTAILSGGTGALLWSVDGVQNGNASVGTIASTGDTAAV